MRTGLGWIVREEKVNELRGKKEEVEKMRKGLSVIAGVAILLFAYSAGAVVVTNDLVSWWKFDEGTGTNAFDTAPAGNNYTGTIDGAAWTNDTPGAASLHALNFDGNSDYVEVSDIGTLNEQTWEAWIYRKTDSGGYERLLSRGDVGNHHVAFLQIKNTDKLSGRVTTDGNIVTSESTSSIPVGAWTYVAMVFDGVTNTLYINGVPDGSAAGSTGTATAGQEFEIGRLQDVGTWYYDFHGTIDEVRVYNRALTSGEIQQNYDAIPEPSTMLLLGGGLLALLAFRRIKAKG